MTDTDTSHRCYNTAHHNRPTPTINTPRWVALHRKTKSAFPLILLRLAIFEQLLFSTFFKIDEQSHLTPALVTQNRTSEARGKIPPTKVKKASHQHQNSIYPYVLTPLYKNTVYHCIWFCSEFCLFL